MRGIVLAAALAGAAAPGVAAAQAIVSDGKMPTPTLVGNIGGDYSISGGTVRGTNLFHSFSSFSVPTGGSATFDGPSSITNILSRVTGTDPSSIDGTISTRGAMPSANFYLINPNGVMFGPNAFLDVGGAFHASTANYVKLDDGTVFSVAAPAGEILTSAAPQAFGFITSNPASITLDGAFLAVDPIQTISLIGGGVHLTNGAVIMAPGGVVNIASVASPGEVVLGAPDLGTKAFASLGEVTISGGSAIFGTDVVNFTANPNGTVVIRSGKLVIEDSSGVLVENFDDPGAPVGIDIGVRDAMTIRTGGVLTTVASGVAQTGGIAVTAGSLTMSDAALIESTGGAFGRPGAIDIHVATADLSSGAIIHTTSSLAGADLSLVASGKVTLSGSGTEISTGTFANDPAFVGGNLTLTAGDVALLDQAKIRTGGDFEQAGERMTLNVGNELSISGLAGISTVAFARAAGALDITASRVVMDGGYINSSTLGTGNGGAISITASDVTLTGGSQIASSSRGVAQGDAGTISINAGSMTVSGVGPADGVGSITLTASPSTGLFTTTAATGNAGQIAVSTPMLSLSGGARISASTSGSGNAGTVQVNAGSLNINGGVIDSSTTGSGDGGAIFLNGSQVSIANGGRVTADSLGSGRTGDVTITASDSIVMTNGSISTRAATSDGGDITLTAPNIVRLEGSQISTSVESGTGSGGNVRIDPQFLIVNGSSITANAFGGPGGNITIIADNYLPSPTSIIEASSALSTPGSIQIASPENNVAGSIAQLPRALVDASRLMRSACSARREGTPSSFTLAGRGGVPPDPDGYLPSAIATAPIAPVALARMDSDDCAR